MAVLATQKITRDGIVPSLVAPSVGSDQFVPTRRTYLWIRAPGGGCTVVVSPEREVFPEVLANALTAVIGASQSAFLGPFEPELFADSLDGLAEVQYTVGSPQNLAVFEVGPE